MEHQEALDTHAAEGYLLGDLTAAEYAAFEEHFADCQECFTDVRDAATVVVAVRAAEEKPVQAKGGQHKTIPWFAAAASVALALLGTVTSFQGYQLAQLRKPRVVPAHVLLGDLRGPKKDNVIEKGNGVVVDIQFDITVDPPSPSYSCKIVDAHGNTVVEPVAVSAEQAREPVTLEIPSKDLQPGDYSLMISGTGGAPQIQRFKVR